MLCAIMKTSFQQCTKFKVAQLANHSEVFSNQWIFVITLKHFRFFAVFRISHIDDSFVHASRLIFIALCYCCVIFRFSRSDWTFYKLWALLQSFWPDFRFLVIWCICSGIACVIGLAVQFFDVSWKFGEVFFQMFAIHTIVESLTLIVFNEHFCSTFE